MNARSREGFCGLLESKDSAKKSRMESNQDDPRDDENRPGTSDSLEFVTASDCISDERAEWRRNGNSQFSAVGEERSGWSGSSSWGSLGNGEAADGRPESLLEGVSGDDEPEDGGLPTEQSAENEGVLDQTLVESGDDDEAETGGVPLERSPKNGRDNDRARILIDDEYDEDEEEENPIDNETEEEEEPTPATAGANGSGDAAEEPERKTHVKFPVRICLPIEGIPNGEAKLYIDAVIRKTGMARVSDVVRIAWVPSLAHETQMREYQLEVEVAIGSYSSEANAIAAFLTAFSTVSAGGLHEQLMLELPTLPRIFNDIRTEDNYIEVDNFAVGNCPNPGLFFVRGAYYTRRNTAPSNQRFAKTQNSEMDRPAGRTCQKLSWLRAEHDQKKLTLKFAIPLEKEEEDGLAFWGYKLELPYSGIQSIAVENMDDTQFNVFFRLKHPPFLYKVAPTYASDRRVINIDRTDRAFSNWSRVLSFPGTPDYYTKKGDLRAGAPGCSREALANCSVLNIALNKNLEKRAIRVLYNLVARIHARCNTIKVFFGAVASMQRRAPQFGEIPSLGTFRADYALKAIISRGTRVTDELFDAGRSVEQNSRGGFFFRRLQYCMKECSVACEEALELVLGALDEKRNFTVEHAFDKLYTARCDLYRGVEQSRRAVEATRCLPPNCVFVRKLMITPSRVLPMPPDVMMTNRVVRHFGADYALRLVFRDENMAKLRPAEFNNDPSVMAPLLVNMVKSTMARRVSLCGRDYYFLAWSNSQMRDHGCYMYSACPRPDGTIASVDDIRDWMGDFSQSKTVPKLMSRMGQCFTQAQPTVTLQRNEWQCEDDVTGGAGHPETGEEYTFSDGVGRLSFSLAKAMAEQLELTVVPSCYQVRFKGFKGVLTIDRTLDGAGRPKVIFRKSQKKFVDSSEAEASVLEVVKYSMPSSICLNRPLIAILDGVAEKQGVLDRMSARIHYYLESELNTIAKMMMSDATAAEVLTSRLALPIDFGQLHSSGFTLTDEPFFRQMLVAIYRYTVSQHLSKAKLELPGNVGRSMFGVMDETGLLQYGQVFVQYSESVRTPSDPPKRHIGPVLVSKNPCHVAGDARMFMAVDQPALHHMRDVIVFPRYGPRPHPDEMAGSDLDGDEYSVVFDAGMFFDTNEQAMIFPKKAATEYEFTPTSSDMADFFLTYLHGDSVGRVSNAHLFSVDARGLFDPISEELARKCSIAVDFPKSGEPAEPLQRHEQLESRPDFAESNFKPAYRSTKINGQLYRRVKKIEEVMELSARAESLFEDKYDELIYQPGESDEYERWTREAQKLREEYALEIQQLMDEYGVDSEAAIISGKLVNPKRLAAMEKDDYSFYNTDKIVELRTQKLWAKYRAKFFEEFGGEDEHFETDANGKLVIRTDPLMRDKARAWYIAAYIDEAHSHEGEVRVSKKPCKSMAWVVWDVLAALKREEMLASSSTVQHAAPVPRLLTERIREFLNVDPVAFSEFEEELLREDPVVEKYLSVYGRELLEILFVLHTWLKKDRLYNRSPLRLAHVSRLLLQYCLGIHHRAVGGTLVQERIVYYPITLRSGLSLSSIGDHSNAIREPGECLLRFLEYLGSHTFSAVPTIILGLEEGEDGALCLSRPAFWIPLSQLAFKTLHEISISGRFSAIGIDEESGADSWSEGIEPITVSSSIFGETAGGVNGREVRDKLKEWTGVTHLLTRYTGGFRKEQLVTMAGHPAARLRLTRLLQMDANQLQYAIKTNRPPGFLYDEAL